MATLLAYIATRLEKGWPETSGEIVLLAGVGTGAVVAVVLAVNELLVDRKRPPLVREANSFFLLTAVAFAIVAGIFAGHAASADDQGSAGLSQRYARHLRQGIRKLEGAGSLSAGFAASSRRAYAQEVRTIARVYEEVVSELRSIDVDSGGRAAHRLLVHKVAAAARAYRRLASVVLDRSATNREVKEARADVRNAVVEIRTVDMEAG